MKNTSIYLYLFIFLWSIFVAGASAQTSMQAIDQVAESPSDIKQISKVESPQATKKWVCEADGLANYRYSGGDWAYIHLSSYSYGHEYRVKKNDAGDGAIGVTQDRTQFFCFYR